MTSSELSLEQRQHFAEEVARLSGEVHKLARRKLRESQDADVEDVVQETLKNAIRSWETFRPEADLLNWLLAILDNVITDRERRRQREPRFLPIDEHHHPVTSDPPPHANALDVLKTLPPKLRNVIQLVDIDGDTYAQAATDLGIPVTTVERRLKSARRKLKLALAA